MLPAPGDSRVVEMTDVMRKTQLVRFNFKSHRFHAYRPSVNIWSYRQSPLTSKWTDGESFYCCCDVAHQRSLFISSTQAQGFSPATMDLRAYKCHTALFTCKTAPVWGWMGEFIDLIKGKYVLLLDKAGVNSMVMLLHFSCCKSKISQVQQVPSVHFSRERM